MSGTIVLSQSTPVIGSSLTVGMSRNLILYRYRLHYSFLVISVYIGVGKYCIAIVKVSVISFDHQTSPGGPLP